LYLFLYFTNHLRGKKKRISARVFVHFVISRNHLTTPLSAICRQLHLSQTFNNDYQNGGDISYRTHIFTVRIRTTEKNKNGNLY